VFLRRHRFVFLNLSGEGEADFPLEDSLGLDDESCERMRGEWELQGRTVWMHNH